MTAALTKADLETLALRILTAGFEGLPARVLESLAEGRFEVVTETEDGPPEDGFATVRIVARRIVIELDPAVPGPATRAKPRRWTDIVREALGQAV